MFESFSALLNLPQLTKRHAKAVLEALEAHRLELNRIANALEQLRQNDRRLAQLGSVVDALLVEVEKIEQLALPNEVPPRTLMIRVREQIEKLRVLAAPAVVVLASTGRNA